MTGANQTVDVTPQNQSMLEFRSNEVHDRGRPRPPHRPSANLVLANGVTVRRLSQRRHHDPRGSIHAASVFGGCTDLLGIFRIENVDAVNKRCGFVLRNASDAGNSRRPAHHGSDDGAAKQYRQATARPRAGDDPDEPHDGERHSASHTEPLLWRRAVQQYDDAAGDRREYVPADRNRPDGTVSADRRSNNPLNAGSCSG